MLWADTTASVIKQRNVADDAWVTLGAVDSVFAFVPIKDEDSMASASASHLSTQSSIKAYVDAQIAGENTLAEDDDVNITTPGDAALLLYDTGTSTWRDAALSGDATISDTGVITIEAGAVDIAHLSASGTAGSSTFLRGDNSWATPTDTNTTYSVQDGELSEINFTSADHTKLNAIEASADVTDATNVTAAGALMDSELAGIAAVKATTGTFLTADQTKLDGIETSATADQTAGEILTLIEDGIDSVHYVDASIDNVHLADDAVGIEELSATGTASSSTFLRGDNSWAAASGAGGKILQVVSATSTSSSSTTSTTFVTSNLTADITPADATNKVLVLITSAVRVSDTGSIYYTLYEDGVNIGHSTKGMGKIYHDGGHTLDVPFALIHLADPGSASAVTYTLYYLVSSGITGELPPNDDMIQNITLMEIAV